MNLRLTFALPTSRQIEATSQQTNSNTNQCNRAFPFPQCESFTVFNLLNLYEHPTFSPLFAPHFFINPYIHLLQN